MELEPSLQVKIQPKVGIMIENQSPELKETAPETGITQYFAPEPGETPEQEESASVVDQNESNGDSAVEDNNGEVQEVIEHTPSKMDRLEKVGKGFEKRIERFNRRLAERDAEIDRWRQLALAQNRQPETPYTNEVRNDIPPKAKPTLAQYNGDIEAYSDALSDWKFREREFIQTQQNSLKTYQERLNKVKENNPDFDEVVSEFSQKYANAKADEINQYLAHSERGAEVYYYLANNHNVTDKLLRLPPMMQMAELGKIEARLDRESDTTSAPRVSKAPRPISSEKGSPRVEKDITDPNISQAEYRELRMRNKKRY